jgi:hypothetical protein
MLFLWSRWNNTTFVFWVPSRQNSLAYCSYGFQYSSTEKISQTCLEIGCMVFKRELRANWELVFVLSYGQCGTLETILSLTNIKTLLFYWLSHLLPTGPVRGYISSRRRSTRTWILGATAWKWLLRIYSAGAAGSLIADSHVETLVLCFGFSL